MKGEIGFIAKMLLSATVVSLVVKAIAPWVTIEPDPVLDVAASAAIALPPAIVGALFFWRWQHHFRDR